MKLRSHFQSLGGTEETFLSIQQIEKTLPRRGTTFCNKVGSWYIVFQQGRVWIKISPSTWPATHYITLANVKTRSGPDRKTVYVIPRLFDIYYLCQALNLDQNTKQKLGVRLTLLQKSGRNMSIFLVNTFISFFEFVSNFPPFWFFLCFSHSTI